MAGKDSPQDVIDAYRRRQQMLPFLIGGLAVLLVVVGVVILIVYLGGPERPLANMFATETPTPTVTNTITPIPPSATPTIPPTETIVPTPTETVTPSGPFEYTVLEKDNCWDIAAKFNVGIEVLLALNNFGNACPIQPGQKILIPAPGSELPTATPVELTAIPRGRVVEYTVALGDSLALIAAKFNATVESIMQDNKITDANMIYVGQKLKIKANMVTPTKTLAATSTPAPTSAAAATTPQPTQAAPQPSVTP